MERILSHVRSPNRELQAYYTYTNNLTYNIEPIELYTALSILTLSTSSYILSKHCTILQEVKSNSIMNRITSK